MSEYMTFPDTVEEFMDSYKIVDTEQVYTNGTEMVPIYRMRQWFEHEPEIVRCKDCENWIPGYITDNDDFIPPKCGKYQQMVGHSSDDYCSLAERRTDGRD